jgi:uncharacterized iron-regulated membrane protein
MFMGLPGSLFLAAVGLLFMAATVSGIVLYGPFMRKLSFGTDRKHRQTRVKWLDIHNLLGAVSLAWVLVVGATGIINTLDTLVFRAWQHRISSQLNIDRSSHPPTGQPSSLQRAVTVARKALPDSEVSFVAFPGSMFGGPRHYAVYMRGQTPCFIPCWLMPPTEHLSMRAHPPGIYGRWRVRGRCILETTQACRSS